MLKVARFYGWTLTEVRAMDAEDFELCTQMIPKLQAQDQLNAISAASFAHTKDEWRRKYHRQLYSIASPIDPDRSTELSTEDMARLLSNGGG